MKCLQLDEKHCIEGLSHAAREEKLAEEMQIRRLNRDVFWDNYVSSHDGTCDKA